MLKLKTKVAVVRGEGKVDGRMCTKGRKKGIEGGEVGNHSCTFATTPKHNNSTFRRGHFHLPLVTPRAQKGKSKSKLSKPPLSSGPGEECYIISKKRRQDEVAVFQFQSKIINIKKKQKGSKNRTLRETNIVLNHIRVVTKHSDHTLTMM